MSSSRKMTNKGQCFRHFTGVTYGFNKISYRCIIAFMPWTLAYFARGIIYGRKFSIKFATGERFIWVFSDKQAK
jgi:hypothetical protein